MNQVEIEALKTDTHNKYACESKCLSKNKPLAYVCVRCGVCYHQTCTTKIKDAYHIIGHLISCCSKKPKYIEQDLAMYKAQHEKQIIINESLSREL